jgi:lysine 2,3-aminomutase
MRVRPYYLYMADETKGASHFRTSVTKGLEIMDKLRGHTSGLAIPHFVIDAPGGGGKIPLLPRYVLHQDDDKLILRNYKYQNFVYKEYKGPSFPSMSKENGEEKKVEIEISNRKNGNGTKPKKMKLSKPVEIPEFEINNN